jgi:hypothetical protein
MMMVHMNYAYGNFAFLFFCLVPRAVCFVSFAETNVLLKKGIMYYVLAPNQFKGWLLLSTVAYYV